MNNIEITDEVLIQELKKRFYQKEKAIEELQSMTEELKHVNMKLQESEQLKSNFIANINNEIINPFASVLGLSRIILEVKKDDWEKVKYMAQLIFIEAHNLDFQLKNIFVAAEIEAGHIYPHISNVDVAQVIQGVIDNFENDLKAKKLVIKYNCELPDDQIFYFKTDAEKLKLITANLLSNAVKFSKGADIEINLKNIERTLIISVKDYGIGISENNKKIIFDRFMRLDTGINSSNRGHGLGLSIIKSFLELFDGDIKIESKVNKGSLFTVSIKEPKDTGKIYEYSSDGNEIFFGNEDELF